MCLQGIAEILVINKFIHQICIVNISVVEMLSSYQRNAIIFYFSSPMLHTMHTKIIILLCLLFTPLWLWAQSDFNYGQQLIEGYLSGRENEKAKDVITNSFLRSENDSRKVIGYVYLSFYYSSINDENNVISALNKAEQLAQKSGDKIDSAYVQYGYARGYYKKLNNLELLIESCNKSISIFEKYPNENFILAYLYRLKSEYAERNMRYGKHNLQEYLKTLDYALKSKNELIIGWSYNNIGAHYNEDYNTTKNLDYIDLAKANFQKSYNHILLVKLPEAKKVLLAAYYINSSYNLTFRENYSEALKLLNEAVLLNLEKPRHNDVMFFIYNNCGDIYEKIEDYKKAEEYYLKAYNIAKSDDKISKNSKYLIYSNLSSVYEKQNKIKNALENEKELNLFFKKNYDEEIRNNTKAMDKFYRLELIKQQLLEKNKSYSKLLLFYSIIAFLVVVIAIFLFAVLQKHKKINKQKNILLAAEKNKVELKLQLELEEKKRSKAEHELLVIQQEKLKNQTLAISLQLDHKKIFIDKLKDNIRKKKISNLERVIKEEESSDNEFDDLQNMFKEINPCFFKRLNELSHSKLTNLDLRYAAYIYINMDNQQIANILKVDINTVRVTKYRLKQKIGLSKKDDLKTFIQKF